MKADEFGERLKDERNARFMSQLQLALAAKVTQGSLGRWELGTTYPTLDNFIELCNVLDMSPNDLLGYTPNQ